MTISSIRENDIPSFPGNADLRTICWTKIQAETGQGLEEILYRKNLERTTSGGFFFWGVGNAPNRILPALLIRQRSLKLIFSNMKSNPKRVDAQIRGMVVWNTYFDRSGREIDLPEWAFITSRIKEGKSPRHYSLVCYSKEQLSIKNEVPFDHLAYKNAGSNGLPIAPSQVTTFVERVSDDSPDAVYTVNMEAELAGDFWVKLGNPVAYDARKQEEIYTTASAISQNSEDWLAFVRGLRQGPRSGYHRLQQEQLRF